MKVSAKVWKRVGLTLLVLLVVGLAVRFLIVPAVIRGQLQARYDGTVKFRGWWLGRSSAGVKNLALSEGSESSSPVWAKAAKVETDLTVAKVLRGRFLPDRIVLDQPEIVFRIDRGGQLLTRPSLKGGGGQDAPVPDVVVRDGQVTLKQEGRPEMTIGPVQATLATGDGGGGEVFKAETNDQLWGKWQASGKFSPGFKDGEIRLKSVGAVDVTPNKVKRIPFVPEDVWTQVLPSGPVAIELDVFTGSAPKVVTTCDFQGATLNLSTLGIVATEATGTMVVDDKIVRLDNLKGKSIGGTVSASGTLDFEQTPPLFTIALNLDDVDVAETPASWQLADAGLTGRLTGTINLKVSLAKDGVDLTGSSGDAVVKGGTIGGVTVKSYKIAMKAEGETLDYETNPEDSTGAFLQNDDQEDSKKKIGVSPLPAPSLSSPGALASWRFHQVLLLIALQDPAPAVEAPKPAAEDPKPEPKPAKTGGFKLPKTISTQVEFDDVDLTEVMARLYALKIPVPVPISGRLSLKARATIPLGSLRDVKDYAFHGEATLKNAIIDDVDLGEVHARVDLEDGVLNLTEFRGVLVDRPEGNFRDLAGPVAQVPLEGPLPVGGFRGALRAEISPPGRLESHFEGQELPLGELLEPILPKAESVSGRITFNFEAGADVQHFDTATAWTLSGHGEATRIAYGESVLDRVETDFTLRDGHLAVPDFTASLGGQPLKASVGLDVAAPYKFATEVDVTGWDLDRVLAFVPGMPSPSPVGGKVDAATRARGTLQPLDWSIEGSGTIQNARAGPIVLGTLPLEWRTKADMMLLTITETRPQGGQIIADVKVPLKGDAPITGSARIRNLDVSGAADLIDGMPEMAGRIDGEARFVVRPQAKGDESLADGNLSATSADLTVRGVPARNIQLVATARDGNLRVDLYTESLDGKVQLAGDLPIRGSTPGEFSGTFNAVGFRLSPLWKMLGLKGAIASLHGVGAIDANLLTKLRANDLRSRGLVEVRELKWGDDFPIGTLKGNVTYSPEGWRVDKITGEVVGGTASGSVVSAASANPRNVDRIEFSLDVERASLTRALAILPAVAPFVDGTGSLRFTGVLGDALRAGGDVSVGQAKLFGFPVSDLRVPIDLQFAPNGNIGALSLRRWNGRFAGGRLTGDVKIGLGNDRTFSTETQVSAVDVESIARVLTDARKPASGKVSGKVVVTGSDPARTETYRGTLDMTLEGASLFELPVFHEIERFLGSTQGGTFDEGLLKATIANRQIVIERLALQGRLVQMHAAGTVGFDTRLELEVLVNTNQIIRETGQALLTIIPGLAGATGRRDLATAQMGNYLQNRLLKFRVTGTLAQPIVNLDPSIPVAGGAISFFAGALKLPLGLFR